MTNKVFVGWLKHCLELRFPRDTPRIRLFLYSIMPHTVMTSVYKYGVKIIDVPGEMRGDGGN